MRTAAWNSPLLSASDYLSVKQYAQSPWPLLIRGETGVGKEYLAQWVHVHSEAKEGPFVPVNCSALPVHLVESELFGYERGAFTGAHSTNSGLIRSADRGTLFLDEVGELEMSAQAKLLRFLDSGEVRALAGKKIYSPSVRVIAATHVDLAQAVRLGRFRLDLLERLSVFCFHIPPLRARPTAIQPLAEKILSSNTIAWEPKSLGILTRFPWPGNIRQLRNVLLRAAVLGNGTVRLDALSAVLKGNEWVWAESALKKNIENAKLWEIEHDVVRSRIQKFGGNKRAAAEDLGIAKSTLHDMLRRWKAKPSGSESRAFPQPFSQEDAAHFGDDIAAEPLGAASASGDAPRLVY
jgi:two-component system, NtrC family, response regulator